LNDEGQEFTSAAGSFKNFAAEHAVQRCYGLVV